MKTEILNSKTDSGIDWDKPQWVVHGKDIVFTNGKHSNSCFEGTELPNEASRIGRFSTSWNKLVFQPIPKEGLVIKISNE